MPGTSRAIDEGVEFVCRGQTSTVSFRVLNIPENFPPWLLGHGAEVEVLHGLPHGPLPDLLQRRDDGPQVEGWAVPPPLISP